MNDYIDINPIFINESFFYVNNVVFLKFTNGSICIIILEINVTICIKFNSNIYICKN